MSDNPNRTVLIVVAALAVILVILLANAGSCSRTGGMGGTGGSVAPVPPGAAAPASSATNAVAQPQPSSSSAYSTHSNEESQQAYDRAAQPKTDAAEPQPGLTQQTASPVPIGGSADVAMSLVYDTSGSMDASSAVQGMTRLESAQKQSRDFVNSVAAQVADGGLTAQIGIAQFATAASAVSPLSSDVSAALQGISALDAEGTTNMYAGLEQGLAQLSPASAQKLMVFLSDGLNNEGHSDSEVLELARRAAGDGVKIYTIGFGPSNSIDENLLQEIASITGGKYAHEDSSSLSAATVGLYATMMDAQLGATQQMLLSDTGTVAQGQTAEVGSFDVNQNGTMQVVLYWPGSVLDMQLTDPDGVQVGAGYAGYDIDTTSIPTRIKIANAKQGTWNMSVYGQQTSMAEEPFYAAATLSDVQSTSAAATAAAPAAMSVPAGASASNNNAETLLFLLFAVVVACLGGVYALSKRNGDDGK